ncbi:two pore domain potassium channel family protein [bacterium SCSIO 12741]|nr:two pore domain potassium channel family protein [bacterium SCSIO 12741]
MNWLETWYERRFEWYLATLTLVIFGSMLMPHYWYETVVAPLFFHLNLAVGLVILSKSKTTMRLFGLALILSIIVTVTSFFVPSLDLLDKGIRMVVFFCFYSYVSVVIIRQVWRQPEVNSSTILGLITGYISLGLIGFFINLFIELIEPGSFKGLTYLNGIPDTITEELLYYSFITEMTIGYGDIVPVSPSGRKASVLLGFLGQFYLVIIMAVIVGKYLNQKTSPYRNKD